MNKVQKIKNWFGMHLTDVIYIILGLVGSVIFFDAVIDLYSAMLTLTLLGIGVSNIKNRRHVSLDDTLASLYNNFKGK